MRHLRFAAGLMAALSLAAPVLAAELRPIVALTGPVVHLRDLFSDAGPNADRVLGPGPAPGGRVTVGAAQLAAIARQFGVDWRPASAGDRAVLEWPGRSLRREDAIAALRPTLIAAGAEADCVIELTGFIPPLVPLGVDPRPEVGQPDFNAATGRFTAVLALTAEGMETITARVGGVPEAQLELPVLAARLPAGAIVRDADVRLGRFGLSAAKAGPVRHSGAIIGLRLKRSLPAGQPLRAEDFARPMVIGKDSAVRMMLDVAGLLLSGQAIALEGEVIGPGLVRVAPETLPAVARRGDG